MLLLLEHIVICIFNYYKTESAQTEYRNSNTYEEPYVGYVDKDDNVVTYNKAPITFYFKNGTVKTINSTTVDRIQITKSLRSDLFNVVKVDLSPKVSSIGEAAFDGCSSLSSITIPDSVTSIGDDAFDGCSSLSSVTIGSSLTSIGSFAFEACSSLTSINYKGTQEQ